MRAGLRLPVRSLSAFCLMVFLSSCSLLQDKEEKVIAPLPDITGEGVRLQSQWSRGVGSQGDEALGLVLTPAIDGGSIYAASAKGRVMALGLADGAVRWKTDLDASLTSAVGAGSDLVIVSAADGGVHALDAASGQAKWRAQASSEVLAAAVTDGDVVVVQAADSRLQAFDAATGNPRWNYSATQAVLSLRGNGAPVIRGGVVYAAFDNGKMAAIDARSGMLVWEQRFIVPDGRSELERVIDVQADPLVTESDVIVGSYQGAIINVARERGQPQWQEKASVARCMAMGDGSVFIVEGDDSVRALRQSSGREAWKTASLAGRQLTAPAVIGDYVAVGDSEGYVHLLSQLDGSYAGRHKVGSALRANLLGDGDTLYVLTSAGKLYALGLRR